MNRKQYLGAHRGKDELCRQLESTNLVQFLYSGVTRGDTQMSDIAELKCAWQRSSKAKRLFIGHQIIDGLGFRSRARHMQSSYFPSIFCPNHTIPAYNCSFINRPAMPCPVPMHILVNSTFFFVRLASLRIVQICRAPVAPSG